MHDIPSSLLGAGPQIPYVLKGEVGPRNDRSRLTRGMACEGVETWGMAHGNAQLASCLNADVAVARSWLNN